MQTADNGELPAARILNTDGTLQSCGTDHLEHEEGEEAFVARIPFATREQFDLIGPMMNEQYMGDYWFSHRGRQVGLKSVVRRDYCFFHHYAQEGRIDTLAADVRGIQETRRRVKFLITGGAGFLGTPHPRRTRAANDHTVVGDRPGARPATRTSASTRCVVARFDEHPDADVCIHLAAKVGRLFGEDDPMETDHRQRRHDRPGRPRVRQTQTSAWCTRPPPRCTATTAPRVRRGLRAVHQAAQPVRHLETDGRTRSAPTTPPTC